MIFELHEEIPSVEVLYSIPSVSQLFKIGQAQY